MVNGVVTTNMAIICRGNDAMVKGRRSCDRVARKAWLEYSFVSVIVHLFVIIIGRDSSSSYATFADRE